MNRLADIALFVPLAAGLHVAAFTLAAGSLGGGTGAGGEGGEDLVTLAAAPPAMARIAQEWDTAPAPHSASPAPASPQADTAPTLPDSAPAPHTRAPLPAQPDRPEVTAPSLPAPPPAMAAPQLPRQMPALPAAPRPDRTAALVPPAPAPGRALPSRPPMPSPDTLPDAQAQTGAPLADSPRPVARPDPTPASTPQQARRAKGTAGAPVAGGQTGTVATPTLSPGQRQSLRAEWGARILARVTRQHHYPRGSRAEGRALVELVVAANGQLLSARLVRSAGDASLDRAALAAVRRAAPFPAAPRGLGRPRDSFTLPLNFERRR